MTRDERIRALLPPKPFGASEQAWADLCAEIEDHLNEAYDASLDAGPPDEEEALHAAFADLGDAPTNVVRNLWWESLGGQWLRAWVQTISIVIFVTVITIMSVRLFVEFRAIAREGRNLLETIPSEMATQFFVWRQFEVAVRRGTSTGALLQDVPVVVTGRPFKNDYESLFDLTDTKGRCSFGPMRVGQYQIEARDPELNLTWVRSATLYPVDDAGVMDLVLPEAAPVAFRFAVPADLLDTVPGLLVEAELEPAGDTPWLAPLDIAIDAAGIRLALREKDPDVGPISTKWSPWLYQPRLYSFASKPHDHLALRSGDTINLLSVRILDEQGVASARRLALGPDRRFRLESGAVNDIPLDVDAASAAVIADQPHPNTYLETP